MHTCILCHNLLRDARLPCATEGCKRGWREDSLEAAGYRPGTRVTYSRQLRAGRYAWVRSS